MTGSFEQKSQIANILLRPSTLFYKKNFVIKNHYRHQMHLFSGQHFMKTILNSDILCASYEFLCNPLLKKHVFKILLL